MSVKLMTATKINALIDNAVKATSKGIDLIQQAAEQTMLHAKEHGDCTLAARLVTQVRDNCKGYVWQGLVTWFHTYSPIKLSKGEDGSIVASLLKEGDKGYKPFDAEEAVAHPAMESKEVKARTDRPIEPFSFAFVKQRIMSLQSQMKKAAEEGGRGLGFTGEDGKFHAYGEEQVKQMNAYLANLASMPIPDLKAEVIPLKPKALKAADSKGQNRRKVTQAKAAKRNAEIVEPVSAVA